MKNDNLLFDELIESEEKEEVDKNTELSLIRTLSAAERTYAAWVRTGFSIVSAGIALGQLLRKSDFTSLTNPLSYGLITVGIMNFLMGWLGYYISYKSVVRYYKLSKRSYREVKFDLIYISILTVLLLAISVASYILLYQSYSQV